jgi:hypothetical protein
MVVVLETNIVWSRIDNLLSALPYLGDVWGGPGCVRCPAVRTTVRRVGPGVLAANTEDHHQDPPMTQDLAPRLRRPQPAPTPRQQPDDATGHVDDEDDGGATMTARGRLPDGQPEGRQGRQGRRRRRMNGRTTKNWIRTPGTMGSGPLPRQNFLFLLLLSFTPVN